MWTLINAQLAYVDKSHAAYKRIENTFLEQKKRDDTKRSVNLL